MKRSLRKSLQARRTRHQRRLRVETLEARRMLATIVDLAAGDQDVAVFGSDEASYALRANLTADFNGDGVQDLITHGNGDGPTGTRTNAGEVSVFYGRAGLPATLDIDGTAGTAADATIYGPTTNSFLSPIGVDDFNGDGKDDLVLLSVNGPARTAYIVFGAATPAASIDIAAGGADVTILEATTTDELTNGTTPVPTGDLNNDGFADLVIVAHKGDPLGRSNAGEVNVIYGSATLSGTINLGAGGQDLVVFGADNEDRIGRESVVVGDINADGIDDLVIGASLADGPGNSRSRGGDVYAIFGAAGLSGTRDLRAGAADLVIYGAESNDFLGRDREMALGDINGDGKTDLLVGADGADGPGNSRTSAGEAYVFYGSPSLSGTIDLAATPADVTLFGASVGDRITDGMLKSGDVNGDGKDDIIIGTNQGDGPGDSRSQAGEVAVVFGAASLPAIVDLRSADVTIYGATAGDSFAEPSNTELGDFNGDGKVDLLLGNFRGDGPGDSRTNAGEAHLVLGAATMPATIDMANGEEDVLVYGAASHLTFLDNTAFADVNDDGADDLIVGARFESPAGRASGAGISYIVFGTPSNQPPTIGAQSFQLDENTVAVGTVAATDPDLPSDTQTFSLTGNGADDARFTITANGQLSFAAAPDFENPADTGGTAGDNVYVVEVQVEDSGGAVDQALMTVTVDPVNDNAPAFTSAASVSVPEGSTAVQTVTASDADLPAQTVVFSIVGGADAAQFSVTPAGVLTLNAAPNFEAPADAGGNNVYDVVIKADDQSGLSATQAVAVTVTNIAPTTPTDGDASADTVAEGAATGTPVGVTVSSTDPLGPAVTYTLTNDAGGRFQIDSATGEVTVDDGTLLDGPATHTITVQAGDGAGGTATRDIDIGVTNVAPAITGISLTKSTAGQTGGVVTLTGAFSDPAQLLDTNEVTVDWGDGSPTETLPAAAVDQSGDTFSRQHTYAAGGVYDVVVTVRDEDGGVSTAAGASALVQGVSIRGGVLQVVGGDARDDIRIQRLSAAKIGVSIRRPGGKQQWRFDAGDVDSIAVFACDGDDRVSIDHRLSQPARIDGGGGNDLIRSGSGNATIDGGLGDDRILSGAGNDVVMDLAGNNRIRTGRGDDTVTTGPGNDNIKTDGGNDVVDAGDGDNRIRTDAGDDRVTVGSGNNRIGTQHGDDVVTTGDGNNVVAGGTGNDILTTGAGDDRLDGGPGADQLNAGDGDNRIGGGSGDDVILSGNGNDRIHGLAGNDVILAGAGNDVIHGGAGDDIMSAGAGDDFVSGSHGRDVVIGGGGQDRLAGGSGVDLLIGHSTANQGVLAALRAALAAWRADDLSATLTALGTLTDDGELDHLHGGLHDELVTGVGDVF